MPNPGTGTFMGTAELPQNRDRREPIAPDELYSSCAKAPYRGLSHLWAQPAQYVPVQMKEVIAEKRRVVDRRGRGEEKPMGKSIKI